MEFSVDEIYGVSFAEFCKLTYTSPDLYIKAIEAEIKMLKDNYEKQRQILQKMKTDDKNREKQELLCFEIQNRLKAKIQKFEKYKREKDGKRHN